MDNKNKESAARCVYHEDGIRCTNSSFRGARGLCTMHYVGLRYHVKSGHKTWEEYEKEGLCSRKMTQDEKNMNQMHPHRSYRNRKIEESNNLDF